MIVKFEHLSGGDGIVPSGYKGLTWDNFGVLDPATEEDAGSGYAKVLSSGRTVAFNSHADPCTISADHLFSFTGGEFAAAWNDNLKVVIRGYVDGHRVGQHVFVLDQDKTHISIDDFGAIDRLVISTKGGHDANGDQVTGAQVAMDDLQLFWVAPGGGDHGLDWVT